MVIITSPNRYVLLTLIIAWFVLSVVQKTQDKCFLQSVTPEMLVDMPFGRYFHPYSECIVFQIYGPTENQTYNFGVASAVLYQLSHTEHLKSNTLITLTSITAPLKHYERK